MENIYTSEECDDDSSFNNLHEEYQGQSNQDSSSQEYFTASSSLNDRSRTPDFNRTSEMDSSDRALESTSQHHCGQWHIESQVHTPSGCSLTDPKVVHQPRISSVETYNLLPGRLLEQANRFQFNIRYAPRFELELQKEIAEAGFVISGNQRCISCQYCQFQLMSDSLYTGCNLWAMHYEHCYHLHLHQVDQQRQRRPIADQGNAISATIVTEYQSLQSISSTSRGQQSGSFSGRSEGTCAFSPAPAFPDSGTPEMLIPLIQKNTVGGIAGSQLGNIFRNTSERRDTYTMSARFGPESDDKDSVLSREMQLKRPTDRDLGILSRNIGTKYTQLGVDLGLQFSRIKEIEMENHSVSDRWLAILIEWRDTQRGQATLGKLEKVFQTLNLNTENFLKLSQ